MRKKELHGVWRVVHHKITDDSINNFEEIVQNFHQFNIEGSELEIDKAQFMTWKKHPNMNKHPFMDAQAFTVILHEMVWQIWMFAENASIVMFSAKFSRENLVLTSDFGFSLELQKVSDNVSSERRVSLVEALQKKEFTDMEIIARNGKPFQCHKCILSSVFPKENWDSGSNFLSGGSEELINATLHYAYSGYLQDALAVDHATMLLDLARKMESADHFVQILQFYLTEIEICEVMKKLLTEADEYLANVMELLRGARLPDSQNVTVGICSNEAGRLVDIFKQAAEELCIAFIKVLLWCDTFAKNRNRLKQKKQKDLCQMFVNIVWRFANVLKEELSYFHSRLPSLTANSIRNVAAYVMPQVEQLMDLLPEFQSGVEETINRIVSDTEETNEKIRAEQGGVKFFWKLKNVLLMSDLMGFKHMQDDIVDLFESINSWSEELNNGSREKKVRCIWDAIKGSLKTFLLNKGIYKNLIENGQRKRNHILVLPMSSRVASILKKIRKQRGSMAHVINLLCNFVPREPFWDGLEQLGLKEETGVSCTDSPNESCDRMALETQRSQNITIAGFKNESILPKMLGDLLESALLADLELIICGNSSGPSRPSCDTCKQSHEVVVFKAHRVVVATRCSWFRRALSSGMRESLDRKFYIEACDPEIFQIFLQYLYVGYLDEVQNFSVEQLVDILTLADRYEVNELVHLCERYLILKLDSENSFFLLVFGDRLTAKTLKKGAISYIRNNIVGHADLEEFENLSAELKKELLSTDHG